MIILLRNHTNIDFDLRHDVMPFNRHHIHKQSSLPVLYDDGSQPNRVGLFITVHNVYINIHHTYNKFYCVETDIQGKAGL